MSSRVRRFSALSNQRINRRYQRILFATDQHEFTPFSRNVFTDASIRARTLDFNRRRRVPGKLEDKFVSVCFLETEKTSLRREFEFRSVRRADIVVCAGVELSFLSPLKVLLAQRIVVFEIYSRQPAAMTRDDIIHMYAMIQRDYRRSRQRLRKERAEGREPATRSFLDSSEKPLLVVISPSAPSQLEELGILAPHPTLPGVWRGLGQFAELIYIGVRDLLPSDRRWDQLRWGFSASDSPNVDRTRFFSDPAVPLKTRRQIQEMIMENKAYATEREHKSIYEQTIAKGERIGEKRGLRIGEKRGVHIGEKHGAELGKREMLLALAREILPVQEFRKIAKIKDLDEQREALTAFVKAKRG